MSHGDGASGEPVGVPVPDDHVGAFVAEVFEDSERDTRWADAVDGLVAAPARDAWDALDPGEQVREVLAKADDYDERAIELLEAVDGAPSDDPVRERLEEAKRLRRNADMLRDAIADAYSSGHVSDEELRAAVETHGFDTTLVATRERLLEHVADAHEIDFRPYGGMLIHEEGGRRGSPDAW